MNVTKTEIVQRFRVWLRALRSGEWKQSRCKYHGRNGGHCCLGVGQIVLGLPKQEDPHKLRVMLGMSHQEIKYLIRLNDDGHRNFAYIADRIEKKLLTKSA